MLKCELVVLKRRKNHERPFHTFPVDCCDDTADLLAHLFYNKYRQYTKRVVGSYEDATTGTTCYHVWLLVDSYIVDITGDQYNNDSILDVKCPAVYVGIMDDFHLQFANLGIEENYIGIDGLGKHSHERLYSLYNTIMEYYDSLLV